MQVLPKPYFKSADGRIILYNGDAAEIMSLLPDKDIKAIITDPPYGITWKSNWTQKHLQKEVLKGDKDLTWMGDFLVDCERLLQPEGSLYVMTRWDKIGFLIGLVRNLTKLNIRNCIVWDRIIHGLGDMKSFAPVYDLILYVTEGKPRLLNDYRFTNLWSINRENDRIVKHPTSKPVAVFERMLVCSTQPGDLILDPFVGSGASLVAANKLNRHAIGIEIDEHFCSLATQRLQQLPMFMEQSEMPL
ncbi:hypothetical protein LCGC14_0442960 [marine sediment metagenome]|uniref:DNA methylase N-4/N-6 domain-containing protein n=1 Tax=marine sediment metagenome TaxID=412755 RepID=A0A0F9V723_9ZZZZ